MKHIFDYTFEYKLEDFWIGAFWKVESDPKYRLFDRLDVWICLIPCFPLHLMFYYNFRQQLETKKEK